MLSKTLTEKPHLPSRTGRGYLPQLDALRFFAILGVLMAHEWQAEPLPWIFGGLGLGFLGVRLFFVLSGFLITGILLECRNRAERWSQRRSVLMGKFYARRFLRIYPLYYAVLAGLLLIGIWPVRQLWPWMISYTTNIYIWHHGQWIGASGIFWTLAVEEQFYLVWPLLVLFVPRRWLVPVLVCMISLAPAFRLFASITEPQDLRGDLFTSATFTLAAFDSLGMGALLAVLFHADSTRERLRAWLNHVALPVGAIGFLVLLTLSYYGARVGTVFFVFGETLLALVLCWLVASAAWGIAGPAGRLLTWRPITYLGKISYGIYIFHVFVPIGLVWVAHRLGVQYSPSSTLQDFALVSLTTIALAALSWHLFERPINDLKRYFPYRDDRRTEIAAASAELSAAAPH
jgi:peptidoglycan/LPS O-acetylase OafA/YrhL